jgi:hypothetical protein
MEMIRNNRIDVTPVKECWLGLMLGLGLRLGIGLGLGLNLGLGSANVEVLLSTIGFYLQQL